MHDINHAHVTYLRCPWCSQLVDWQKHKAICHLKRDGEHSVTIQQDWRYLINICYIEYSFTCPRADQIALVINFAAFFNSLWEFVVNLLKILSFEIFFLWKKISSLQILVYFITHIYLFR